MLGGERACDAIASAPEQAHEAQRDRDRRGCRNPEQCERAPAVMVTAAGPGARAHVQGGLFAADDVLDLLTTVRLSPDIDPDVVDAGQLAPQAGDPSLRLLKRVGRVDPTSLDAYRDDGGYRALHKALAMGPQAVIDEVTAALDRHLAPAGPPKRKVAKPRRR